MILEFFDQVLEDSDLLDVVLSLGFHIGVVSLVIN